MPTTNELCASLGTAIAELERAKLMLLDVFTWGSISGGIDPKVRSSHCMRLQIARSLFPVIDISLRRTLRQLTGKADFDLIMLVAAEEREDHNAS